MIREIKFRAWNGSEMKQVDQITIGKNVWNCEKGYGISIPFQPHIILMQFTGLLDKNGKEIYEGDIVKYDHEDGIVTAKVVYKIADCESMLISGFYFEMISIEDTPEEPTYEGQDLEITGNIYEPNPVK